jgi:hypothetical protein
VNNYEFGCCDQRAMASLNNFENLCEADSGISLPEQPMVTPLTIVEMKSHIA